MEITIAIKINIEDVMAIERIVKLVEDIKTKYSSVSDVHIEVSVD